MRNKRDEQRRQWWQQHHDEHEVKLSMKRRNAWHDYYSRCIYMITLAVEGRRPILGDLCGPDDRHPLPWVRPTVLGQRVLDCWNAISIHYPEVRTIEVQLMPDHIHGVLFVTKQVPFHLGKVVNGLHYCNNAVCTVVVLQGITLQ